MGKLTKADWYSTPDDRRGRARLGATVSHDLKQALKERAEREGEPVSWLLEKHLRKALGLRPLPPEALQGKGFHGRGRGQRG